MSKSQVTRTPFGNGKTTEDDSFQPYVRDHTQAIKKAEKVVKEAKEQQKTNQVKGCGCF